MFALRYKYTPMCVIIDGRETAFHGVECQSTSGKPLKRLKPTMKYYAQSEHYGDDENGIFLTKVMYMHAHVRQEQTRARGETF
jgi:hypothetical protein